jgi:hypothetical protein
MVTNLVVITDLVFTTDVLVTFQPHLSCLHCCDSLRFLFPFSTSLNHLKTYSEFSHTNSIAYIACSGKSTVQKNTVCTITE